MSVKKRMKLTHRKGEENVALGDGLSSCKMQKDAKAKSRDVM